MDCTDMARILRRMVLRRQHLLYLPYRLSRAQCPV